MKKTLMILAALAVLTTANAQEEKWYGSKEGGFAITFNANPVINYVGNMFNGKQNNTLEDFEGVDGKNLFNGTTITGKYFLKDNLALDLGFGFNNKYNVKNFYDSDDVDKVTKYTRGDNGNPTTTAFHLKLGAEYRLFPGKRLQPLFGADVIFQHTNSWTYTNNVEEVKDAAGNVTQKGGEEYYSGNPTNALGLILNAGVEYFIIPQISLGANLNFGIAKRWARNSRKNDPEGEGANKNYSRIVTKTTWLQTGYVGANVSLNFYF
jgi:hypothetical protein